MFVPVIPEVRTEDIKELFKVKYLTKLEGKPSHDWLETVEKEMGSNSIVVKCSFGGGKLGCLGIVYNNTRFRAKSGHDWIVPASRGAFPTFPNGATLAQKKQLISGFIECEKDRKVVKTCEDLLKGQLIESIDKNFILELKDDMVMNYDVVTLIELCTQAPPRRVRPPDLTKPIDTYFVKQGAANVF